MDLRKLIAFIIIGFCLNSGSQISAQKKSDVQNFREESPAVVLDSSAAFSEGKGVWIEWTTSYEKDNLGFNIYRVSRGRVREQINSSLVAGRTLSSGSKFTDGNRYSWFDVRGDVSSRYEIERLGADGISNTLTRISTTYVDNLTPIAGATAKQLRINALSSKNVFSREDLLLPEDLRQEVNSYANSTSLADPITQRWVAAQPGVKIGVKQDGLYRVTRAQLQTAGFDVNSASANWQLYVEGEEHPILVGPNGDYIEFYGRGIDIPETDTRIYFLVTGNTPGKRIQSIVRRRLSADVVGRSFNQSIVKEDRTSWASGILNGEAENFFGAAVVAAGTNQTVTINNLDATMPQSSIDVQLQGQSSTPHIVEVLLNGTLIGTMNFAYGELSQAHFDIPTSLLVDGNNTVRLVSLFSTSDFSFVDWIKISYPRVYQATQDRLSFYTQNYRLTTVRGFSSADVRVFDMTDSKNPLIISNVVVQPDGAAFAAVLPPHRSRVMYAVSGSGLLSPASITQNTPSTWSTSAHSANLVIISYGGFMTQAEQWAAMRRLDPMNVEVINVEDIFDEFGYGLPTSDSIRSFLNFATSTWQQSPGYALLVGDASVDPRNYLGRGYNNLVPTKLVDTSFMETGSDDALADFDIDGLADISIGRIPVRTAAGVTNALNKTIAFEATRSTAPQRGFYCVSDAPVGFDFQALCNRLGSLVPSTIPKMFLNRDEVDSLNQLLTTLNAGKYVVNYSGHGNHVAWSNSFYNSGHAAQQTNTNLSIFVSLSCLNAFFLDPRSEGLSEALINNSDRAAVAVWASSALTTPDVQEVMATRFYQQLFGTSLLRLGDLVRDAKTTIPGGRDVRLSWALIGDPTLRVR